MLNHNEFLFKEIIEKHYYFGIPLGQSDIILDNSFYLIFVFELKFI
mgnify:CR=1 FL=1